MFCLKNEILILFTIPKIFYFHLKKKKNYFHNFFSEIFIIRQRQKSYIKCKKKNTMYETYEKDDIKDSW